MYGTERKFGIEIEAIHKNDGQFDINSPTSRSKFFEKVKAKIGYDLSDRGWRMTSDGSLQSSYGFELKTGPTAYTKDSVEYIKEAINAITETAEWKVNKQCGIHIHLDARDLNPGDVARTVMRYGQFEDKIDDYVHVSRRGNRSQFCASLRPFVTTVDKMYNKFNEISDAGLTKDEYVAKYYIPKVWGGTKYLKLAPRFFYNPSGSKKTIEFRHYHGSVDPDEITNWLAFCQTFTSGSCSTDPAADRDCLFKVPDKVAEYLSSKKLPKYSGDDKYSEATRVGEVEPTSSYWQYNERWAIDAKKAKAAEKSKDSPPASEAYFEHLRSASSDMTRWQQLYNALTTQDQQLRAVNEFWSERENRRQMRDVTR